MQFIKVLFKCFIVTGVYLKLRDVLYTDDAVASMAAAYAMGLVYCGAHSDIAIEEPYAEMMQVSTTLHCKKRL